MPTMPTIKAKSEALDSAMTRSEDHQSGTFVVCQCDFVNQLSGCVRENVSSKMVVLGNGIAVSA
jgi:hypothetical protein